MPVSANRTQVLKQRPARDPLILDLAFDFGGFVPKFEEIAAFLRKQGVPIVGLKFQRVLDNEMARTAGA